MKIFVAGSAPDRASGRTGAKATPRGGSRRPVESPKADAERDSAAHRIQAHEIAVAIRNSLKLGGSLILTWSVALIVKFQIPAHLGPVRQGHFGFAESFAGMFFTAIGFGVDTYIVKEVSVRPKHASDILGGVFALRAVVSVVLFAAMAVTLWVTGRDREIQLAVAVFGGTQFLISINSTLATVLQATTQVGRLAIANIVAKVIWGVGLLVGLHFHVNLYALALPMLAAEVLRTAFLVPAARSAADVRYRIDRATTRAVLLASVPYFIGGLAIGFGNNLGLSALEFIRKDEREVGWFAASQNLSSLAMLLHPLLAWIVMPMLSRAQARSGEEMMAFLRRSVEGLIVVIAPITTLISAGSEIFVRAAFGEKYAPAATGMSILSLVFLMIYLNIILGNALVIAGKSWSVTVISIASVLLMAVFMLVFVPAGRVILGTGGECAGAAVAVIATEAFVNVAMLWRFRFAPFDQRNVTVLVKSVAVSVLVLVADRVLRRIGPARLIIDLVLYVGVALAIQIVRPDEVRRVVRLLRSRRKGGEGEAPG